MQDWQERVVQEKAELDERRERLEKFCAEQIAMSEADRKVSLAELGRLDRQAHHMQEYSSVLGERIAAWPPSLGRRPGHRVAAHGHSARSEAMIDVTVKTSLDVFFREALEKLDPDVVLTPRMLMAAIDAQTAARRRQVFDAAKAQIPVTVAGPMVATISDVLTVTGEGTINAGGGNGEADERPAEQDSGEVAEDQQR